MSASNDKQALLVLNAVESLQPRVLLELLQRFGSPSGILEQKQNVLAAFAGAAVAAKISGWKKYFDPDKEMKQCEKRGISWLDWNDERYPESLRHISQPPPVLYFRGSFDDRDKIAMAIVGSRQASRYGVEMAGKLAGNLAAAGLPIVSGLARGIDTAAHEAALQAGGRTVAVMGSGFLRPYPAENIDLLERIAASGLVVTEFPLSRPPLSLNFPRRNRIISGWSLGVVVVEAAKRSGSLITASHALEQGRSVFAVPGRLDSEYSQGANTLIQQGAKLIASTADIAEDLQYVLPKPLVKRLKQGGPAADAGVPPQQALLTPAQRKIMELLASEPVEIDDIIRATRLSAPEVAGGLLVLEMHGLVRQFPGKQFAKKTA